VSRRAAEPGVWEQRLDRLVLGLGGSRRGADGTVHATGILRVFQFAERLAQCGHVKYPIRPGSILLYEIGPFPGVVLPLAGQPPVLHGEPVVILHWDNVNVGSLAGTFDHCQTMTFQGSRVIKQELAALAGLAAAGAIPADVRAVWTETVLFAMLARFRFRTRPAPRSWRTPFVRLYLLGLLKLYGRDRPSRAREHSPRLRLGEAWISMDELLRRFAPP
jgi:hypothetical protein